MSPHRSTARRLILAAFATVLFTTPVSAQRTSPPPPAEYDVQIRYSIRAGTNQRIALFQGLERYLESIGFRRTPSDDPLEAADHTAERLHGTIPSSKVREILRSPQVRTMLLKPAGTKLPENPDARVLVQIELESKLSPSRQRDLAKQARQRLAGIGFVEKAGYDHQKHVRLFGTLPAGEVETLLRDLRDVPAGWLAPEVPRADLPEPIRDVNPIRIVEVLREPDGVPANTDAATPVAAEPTFEKLPLDLRDIDPAETLRLEAILAHTPADGDRSWRSLFERESVAIEGRLGPVVTFRGPGALAKDLVVTPAVAGVRRPAAATRQPSPPPGPVVADAVARSGAGQMPALYRGRGVTVVVIGSDFQGAERIANAAGQTTTLVDLTAARNVDLLPEPAQPGDDIGSCTRAALAVRLAAPECNLMLLRVDRAAAYMIGDIARYLHGDVVRSDNLTNRNRELLADNDHLRIARDRLQQEQAALALDFGQDEATVERRKNLIERHAALDAQDKQYLGRLMRFTRLEDHLVSLRNAEVVVNGLSWDIGYPVDGVGPLSRAIDSDAFAPPTRDRRGSLRYWFQSAGNTRGQVWNASLVDADGNGVFEFASQATPLPAQRWSRELNFLGWIPVANASGSERELPAGAKLRVALQWTEVHDRRYDDPSDPYRTPITDLRVSVLRQRDPSGTKAATDDFNVVVRSAKLPELIERTGSLVTYEQVLEFTAETAGSYALQVAGSVPSTILPADTPSIPAQHRQWEPRVRLFVEASGAANGRPVFADFDPQVGGVGTPGDALQARTIGAANQRGEPEPFSAAGPAAGRDLLAVPSFIAFDRLPLPGGDSTGGTGTATGFAGGIAAAMISAGAPVDPSLRWLGIQPGGLLVVPKAWIDQLHSRQLTPGR